MTDQDLEELIDQLNRDDISEKIFLSVISDNVCFAKVWQHEPRGGIAYEGSDDFYFIKSNDIFVAAIFDMVKDLHVFVKEEHRGHGYLAKAMKQTILPHLYQRGRVDQYVTFKDSEVGKYIKKCWAFEIIGEGRAKKSLCEYEGHPKINTLPRSISREEFNTLSKNIDRAKLYITMVAEQLEAAFGQGNDNGLHAYAKDIEHLEDDIFDFIQAHQIQSSDSGSEFK